MTSSGDRDAEGVTYRPNEQTRPIGRADLGRNGGPPPPPATAESPADQPTTVIGNRQDPGEGRASETGATPALTTPETGPGSGAHGWVIHHRAVAWHRASTGPIPVQPGQSTGQRWRKVLKRTLTKTWDDSLFGWSSQAGFWCALSTAPLLLALLGSVGFVAGWFGPGTITQVEHEVMQFLNSIFSPEVVDGLLRENVHNLLNTGQADVVSVGFVISLWAGSSAISAFVEAITIAYGQHEVRHPAVERFFALGLYLIALVCGVFLLPLAAIGPERLVRLFPADWRDTVERIVDIAYYPVLGIVLVLLVATLYKVAPKHKHPWKRGIPGAALAAIIFLITSYGLRLYVEYVSTHGLSYGALATPIVFLLFYYFVSMAIIIGAQFNNATLEYYPPKRSARAMRKWRRLEMDASSDED